MSVVGWEPLAWIGATLGSALGVYLTVKRIREEIKPHVTAVRVAWKNIQLIPDIHHQLYPNQNGSLFDKCDRIEKKQAIAMDEIAIIKSRVRELGDAATTASFTLDVNGNPTWVSPAWTEITRQTLADIQDGGWKAGIHPDDREKIVSSWMRSFSHKDGFTEAYRIVQRHTGAIKHVESTCKPVRSEDGRILGWTGKLALMADSVAAKGDAGYGASV